MAKEDKNEASNEEQESVQTPSALAPKPNGALGVPIAIVFAGLLVAGAILFSGDQSERTTVTDTAPAGPTNEELLALAAIQDDDHIRGNENAEVYILEFSDTECPFCKRFHETMKDVIEQYDGRVAWVYRHFPLPQLHPTAPRESEATECAAELGGENVFWNYLDEIYAQTPDGKAFTDDDLFRIAGEVGLPIPAFEECLNSGRHKAIVDADVQNAVALGGRGTPHSLIIAGDQIIPIQGAQPLSVVSATLDSVLSN